VNSLKKLSLISLMPGIADRRSAASRARVIQLSELPQALFTKQAHVHREGQGAEAGVGTDVRSRLLTADVLFAG
jgi:hypothetical protein